ncbi:carotenoid oxygenase family protein [Streptosporangium roseum]|uniref:Dioxygenase n=1 Tax=Streptosporangium roseum (strain ATCC 12428 / DSM 43021 / JCM 3005 / KCTC 9067 / NCIMB 10171 / NRRL 2505 / NI 9100) TaxID=479432 RepID=D2BDC0_STRRD|nr:carotenoid oxygenase family protein [Streptosporangium roseum]ACZ86209.1 9-cis-epoxycarotenoid dioxygenase [Streptosporangium roseum DSM 43021]
MKYLEGHFAPVNEEITVYDLPVTGRIPAELNGRYLRNGPNPLGVEDPGVHIWGMGQGMVHGVRLRDGRAEWYRNRSVRTPGFAPMVHVIEHARRTFAMAEGGLPPAELDAELNTVGVCDLGGTAEGFTAGAHSKHDPLTGELHSLSYMPGRDFVQYIVTDAGGSVARATAIPMTRTPFMHDFALTGNHVVLWDTPLGFDGFECRWAPEHPARVGVMPRTGGDVRWLDIDPVHVSHTLNAYDDGDSIVVDVVTAEGPFDPADPGAIRPVLDRWTIGPDKVHQRRIDDRPQDFPRVNDARATRPYRYGYSAATALYGIPFTPEGMPSDDAFTNALVKHDLQRGTTEVHRFGKDEAVGEASFAATGQGEDEGYLLTYVHDPLRNASDLVILSAQDFTGEPVARVHLPVRVPLGLHGNWMPDL